MATISRRGSKWFAQIRRKGFSPKYKTFASKRDATFWVREEEANLSSLNGHHFNSFDRKLKLGDVLNRYVNEVTVLKKGCCSEKYRIGIFQSHPISELSISNLVPSAFAEYRDTRLSEVKPGTVKRELGILRHAIEVARREWGYPITQNPLKQISFPKVVDGRNRRITSREIQALEIYMSKLQNVHMLPLVFFALETAMRRGELLNLRWKNVNLDDRIIHVVQSKNGEARKIPLTQKALDILISTPKEGPLIFPLTGNAVRKNWSRVCHKAGIEDLRFHDLRHEAISRFGELGLSIPEIALISGHKDTRMLMRYVHLNPIQLGRKIDAIEIRL